MWQSIVGVLLILTLLFVAIWMVGRATLGE
jgi:hypothetical protein